jgi:uncharacterized protein (TIGR03066 family)
MIRTLFCLTALVLCFAVVAEDKKDERKIDAKLLVGKWEPKAKGTEFVIEYTKDGKVAFLITSDGKVRKYEGTYEVEGNKLTTKMDFEGKSGSAVLTINKLTDADLVTTDATGTEVAFTRIKDKK